MRTDSSPGTLPAREHLPAASAGTPVLDVVIPVYNEEKDLQPCVRRLHEHLTRTFPYAFRITIADNASTDTTPQVAARLEAEIAEVRSFRLEHKGRGRALRTVWSASSAPILAYMDVDLSTDLNALLPLVAPLISGHSDLAIGSRLARSSRVVRGPKREFISRAYNLILRGSLQARFSDAQCGFKAIRGDVAQELLPLIEDTGWFFDTEMLVLAERAGLRIHEVPVDWVDDPDSTVHIVKTATDDLKGVWRVGKALATGSLPLDRLARPFGDDPRDREIKDVPRGLARQLVGFCVVGGLSTLFYLLLYSVFRQFSGSQVANALALLVSAVGNTAANRRLTFGVRGRDGVVRHQAQGLVVFGIGLALTSGSLAALNTATSHPAHSTELAVLIAANLAATVLRFLLFRAWVFPDRHEGHASSTAGAAHHPTSPTYPTARPGPGRPRRPLPQRPTTAPRSPSATGRFTDRRHRAAAPGARDRHRPEGPPMTTHYDPTTDERDMSPATWSPPPTAPARSSAPGSGEPRQPFLRRLWRGRPEDPRGVRPAFLAVLLLIGALYTWNLTASGYANSFYSAAVQAGSQSWKAFFFGSLDAANAITVDKPPASLWPMALSVRLLGLNSFAILFPQVLMAVATAAVLYAAVRRRFSAAAGFLTLAVFALTPVAALMFRFNNPDAALALLMATAVYCTLRALEQARTKWLVWAGAVIGLAFLVKTLQAFLILPVLALVYVLFAPASVKKRVSQVLLAGLAMVVAGGWWVAIVELWPASSRPYIGGSQNNSFLELTFGYNGLGRINGNETGSVGGGGGNGGGNWGETGWDRMFSSTIGGQISWLIPAALVLLVAALWITRKARRTDTARAAFLLWGGSLLITMVIFSFMQGIFHEYYTVALAPYLAPLIGMGAATLWEERDRAWASLTLAGATTATAVWGYVLLNRSSDYLPWLRWLVLVGGLTAALGLIFVTRLGRRPTMGVVGLGLAAALAGPTAYTLTTLNEAHTGSIVTAGPAVAGGRGFPGGGGGPGGFPGGGFPGGGQNQQNGTGTTQGQGNQQGNQQGGFPGGGMPGQNQQNGNGSTQGQNTPGGGMGDGGRTGGGGMGGLLNGASVSSEAEKLLETDSGQYTWVAAAIGAQNAASYQLATGVPVMAIGGFNGTDPSPTPAQFQKYVAEGKIHYFIASGTGGGPGGNSNGTSARITSWVEANFKKVTVGSATFYDLTQQASS